jgi:hypothetical protein
MKIAKPKNKRLLRLYVWYEFDPDWSFGMAFAIAESEAAARNLIEAKLHYGDYVKDWGKVTVYPLTRRVAGLVGGGA